MFGVGTYRSSKVQGTTAIEMEEDMRLELSERKEEGKKGRKIWKEGVEGRCGRKVWKEEAEYVKKLCRASHACE